MKRKGTHRLFHVRKKNVLMCHGPLLYALHSFPSSFFLYILYMPININKIRFLNQFSSSEFQVKYLFSIGKKFFGID
jgi:hypothetical protein